MTSFGFLLPTREIVMTQEVPNFRQILDLAEHAEALGFDSVWVGDSVLARPRFEALTTLAAVAARTQRVKLGTAVLLPMLRQPVVLANEVANLDHVAQGRLILGVGIGNNNPAVAQEFAACGVPIGRRVGMFEEGITLMRRLWTEPEVTFQGRYFQVQSVRLGLRPLQQSGVSLWLAGSGDNALRRVLRLGGWLVAHFVLAPGLHGGLGASPSLGARDRARRSRPPSLFVYHAQRQRRCRPGRTRAARVH